MFNFLDGLVPLWLRVFLALIDYLLKAADQWRETEVGAREWGDFTTLYEQMLNDGTQGGVTFGVENRANVNDPAQPQNRQNASTSQRGSVVFSERKE